MSGLVISNRLDQNEPARVGKDQEMNELQAFENDNRSRGSV